MIRDCSGRALGFGGLSGWADTALDVVRELRRTLVEPGDLAWRAEAARGSKTSMLTLEPHALAFEKTCPAITLRRLRDSTRHRLALDWPRYSHGKCAEAQTDAEHGIWSESFAKPWLYRPGCAEVNNAAPRLSRGGAAVDWLPPMVALERSRPRRRLRERAVTEHMKTEISDGVPTLTLQRLEKKNALTGTMGSVKCVGSSRKELHELINPGVTPKANRAVSPSSRWTFTSSAERQPRRSRSSRRLRCDWPVHPCQCALTRDRSVVDTSKVASSA